MPDPGVTESMALAYPTRQPMRRRQVTLSEISH